MVTVEEELTRVNIALRQTLADIIQERDKLIQDLNNTKLELSNVRRELSEEREHTRAIQRESSRKDARHDEIVASFVSKLDQVKQETSSQLDQMDSKLGTLLNYSREAKGKLDRVLDRTDEIYGVLKDSHSRSIIDPRSTSKNPSVAVLNISNVSSQRAIYDPERKYPHLFKVVEGQRDHYVKRVTKHLNSKGATTVVNFKYYANGITYRDYAQKSLDPWIQTKLRENNVSLYYIILNEN